MAAQRPGAQQSGGLLAGWRGLGRFWIGVLVVLAFAGSVLEMLGPSPRLAMPAVAPVVAVEHPPAPAVVPEVRRPPLLATQAPPKPGQPGRALPGPIADPDPALLQPYAKEGTFKLPRIATDGREPMSAYAAGFDPTTMRPRVGMLIAGIGMNQADSLAAIKDLPGGVTLAVSPYAGDIDHLLDVARITEHEYLLSIPMEPEAYPINDPDDRHALMTALPPADNLNRLRWLLSRVNGYVGVTNALGPMHGERLSASAEQFGAVLEDVGHRGLLFVDARTGKPLLPYVWNRSVDVAVDDDPVDAATLDRRLDLLTHIALDRGSALGIVWVPRPVTLARVAAWTNGLVAKGLALAPVSALVLAPAKQEVEK